ncbi:hypothetical protein B0T22DRAFT_475284 [Podospora appendiculata]|uniref:Nucleoprotein TPR/MLP1 domain-containing protein n=1 Tax=Podospora appendiculata TaxID=314037 RepID=A0AAE1CF77_9PEZI|nr:hypothetical protein B0T22DRAFT_475284 [Podospora appendiculata]
MAAADVDLSYLTTHVGVSELSLDTAVTAPTPDLVKEILETVLSRVRDLEQEKFQLGVELEGAIRSSESRIDQFKATTDKALKDVEENTRRSLENELQTLKSSGSATASEIETLRSRIESLETSNRETLGIVDSKTQANAELFEDLQKQHQKTLKLNQEVTSLNQAVQVAQTAANSAKYREDALKQEMELVKSNNDWLDKELKTKSAEALKFRKEKGARIAELQRLNEDANSKIDSLTRSEQLLRKRLDEAQSKADEALTKVQQLQEAAARAEESFKQELESSRRLVELKDQQSQTHRNRLKEVEIRLEQVKDDSAEEVRRLQRELEQEKEAHIQTQQHVQELQSEVDRFKAILESQDGPSGGEAPQTPRPNGSFLNRPGSPFGTPASMRKSSMRASDALEELYNVKAQLSGERRRSNKLQEDLDDTLNILESKLPEIDELGAETERLRNDAIQMSQIMEQSYEERDIAVKAARKAEATAATAQAEVKILRTQLRDLSTQIHMLIFNIHAQEKGMDQLTEEEVSQFERLQRGEIAEDALADMSPTHAFISEKFVVFKDIYELQAKNQELLNLTRELAEKMENEEALLAQEQAAHDREEVQQLRGTVSTLQDEVRSITVRMKSYMTERDMFRRMLQQKANSAEIHAALGSSSGAGQREVLASIEQNSDADLTAALRELQSQFDSYRNDQNTDRNSMKEQIEKLSAEKSSLQSEISRVSSQLTLATERYNMLESNYKAVQSEKQELQTRSQFLSESAAKQDIRTQQVAEDLVETRGQVESLRNENANLKAEKTLWKSIQERLSQDNENLAQERTRLSNLISSKESLLNERELSESEARRRAQSQIESLEAELSTTKRKLAEEVDESKKIQLRKEFDAQQFQKRIDELTTTISQVKEENVAAKTSRDHLQARVGELEIELRGAQERADRLRPQPTPRAPPAATEQQTADAESQARIEELENEVLDLKNGLELANAQLENAMQQSDTFKQLSREMEEELSSINESQETYRVEMDKSLAAKDNTIDELQQRIEALSTELSNTNSELNMLRDSQADVARRFEEKERILLSDIARLKDEEERYKESAKFHQEDLRAQADIASKAQQDYEQELVRHAKAAEQLQELRAEYNHLKTQSASWKAEAESARLSLAQSEQSWEERRQQLEQEMAEIQTRRDDVNAQNKLLHQQLDSVSAQISSLQQNRATVSDSTEGPEIADTATEGLRELNNYLRREKEILEVQYDLKVQESKRLQQQLEYSQSQLDEARLKLDQERRSQADSSRNSLTHKDLMGKLNELNLIRESNVTLRNDNQRAQAQIEQKAQRIEVLEARILPLEVRISELELDTNFKGEEIKQLHEARDKLQKRVESILSKYGQADPHEIEQLRATIVDLEAERDALKVSQETLRVQLEETQTTLETERSGWKSTRERLADDFKNRYKIMKGQRDEATTEKNGLQTELKTVNEKLTGVQRDLETAKQNLSSLEEKNRHLEEQAAVVPVAEEQVQAAAPISAPVEQDSELAQQLEAVKQELEIVASQKAAAEAELERLRTDLATALAERDEARAEASRPPSNGVDADMQEVANDSQVEPAPPQQPSSDLSDEERKALEDRIATAEAKAAEFEAKAKELEEHADNIVKQRSEKMKSALNKKLAESKEAMEKVAHEEKLKMEAEYNLKLQQELAIVKAEQVTSTPLHGLPATPAKPSEVHNVPKTPIAGTPGLIDLSNLNDTQTRDFITSNPTVMSIVKANVKKLVAVETKKLREEVEGTVKTEYEQKINSAREQAAALSEKKSALRINMLDRQTKTAQAKIAVVETAAKETPQRPVVEVWDIAKDAKPAPPAPTPNPTPAPAVGKPVVAPQAPQALQAPVHTSDTPTASTGPTSEPPNAQAAIQTGLPQPNFGAKTVQTTPAVVVNPFGQQQPAAGLPLPTGSLPVPVGGHPLPPNPFGQPAPPQVQVQNQTSNQPPVRTGIPMPRGGANAGRGRGTYQAGPGRGGQGSQRGRGNFRGGGGSGVPNYNPHATEFSPTGGGAGNKRPRNDSEADAGGVKRPRGGGRGGGAAGGGAAQP